MTRRTNAFLVMSLGLVLGAGALGCSGGERVVVASPDQSVRGVVVTGNGEVSARPDIGHLSLGVEARAATADQAIADVNTRMRAVIAALKAAGVAEKDVRTSRLSIYREVLPQPYPPAPVSMPAPAAPVAPTTSPAAPPKGAKTAPAPTAAPAPMPPAEREVFRASNSVEVTLRDLDRAGQVITAATQAGANELGGIGFSVDDPTALEQKAREKAMSDAKARAEQLAKLAGVKLGPVESIQESGGPGYFPPPMAAGMMMKSEAADAVPVERGEIKVSRQVQVRYGLGQ